MHDHSMRGGALGFVVALLVTHPGSASLGAPAPARGREALDYAFRFASAIHVDAKDQGMAQEAVVLELARSGLLDDAVQRADDVVGWRRGTVYADLAAMLAEQGRREQARALIAKAEATKTTIEGWQQKRIEAHLAQAYALLGESDRAKTIATDLAENDPRQYVGRSLATEATAQAAQGNFDEAMTRLDSLQGEADLEHAWWRTVGYVAIARRADLPREKRIAALGAARRAADAVPGWKRAEALESIADELRVLGKHDAAREALEKADAIVMPLAATMPIKAPLLANLGRSWAELGDDEHAREILKQAEAEVPSTLIVDRPAIYANVATGYIALGDRSETARLFGVALGAAESLVNARPRALAVVAICRSMGRESWLLDPATKGRLDALYTGLREPW